MKIRLDLVRPSPRPVRSGWDEEKMEGLAQSIKEQGLIVPVKVRPSSEVLQNCELAQDGRLSCGLLEARGDWTEDDCGYWCTWCGNRLFEEELPYWELVYGHRRVEAARRAGLTEIEAIVEGVDDTQALIQALIENVQREDLAPLDKARALKGLMDETGWSQSEVARRGLMPVQTISWTLALLQEDPEIQAIIAPGSEKGETPEGYVTPRHVTRVRETGLPAAGRTAVLQKAASEGLSSEQTRRVAETIAATNDPEKRKVLLETDARSPVWEELATIQHKAKQEAKAQWWDDHPSTKKFLELLGMQDRVVRSAWESAREEKIPPEHLPYLIKKLREAVAKLNSIIEQLEAKAAKYH